MSSMSGTLHIILVHMDIKMRVHVIVLTIVETIKHQISDGTSSINVSGLGLLILVYIYFSYYLIQCCFYCADLPRKLSVFFSHRLFRHRSQLILICVGLLQVRMRLLLTLISLEYRFMSLHLYNRFKEKFHSFITR